MKVEIEETIDATANIRREGIAAARQIGGIIQQKGEGHPHFCESLKGMNLHIDKTPTDHPLHHMTRKLTHEIGIPNDEDLTRTLRPINNNQNYQLQIEKLGWLG